MKNIIVITGASSGIGKEFALQLSERNDFDEIWAIARDKDKLDELKSLINKEIKVLSLDLSDNSEIEKYKLELEKDDINIKLLVNCAGFGKFEHDENIPLDTKLNMIDLNVKAVVSMCNISLPFMKEDSAIINIASTAAFQPIPYINIYAATKSFILSYSRALNRELKYRKIKVLAVCPFWTKTNFFDRAIVDAKKEVIIKYIAMYKPEDVVRKALKDLKKKHKDFSMCGFKNNAQTLLTKIFPHSFVMSVWMMQQKLDGTPGIRKNKSIK